MADSVLHCSVMTPEGTVFEGEVGSVVAPAVDGELAILRNHAPLVAALGHGQLRVHENGNTHHWLVLGGFIEVLKNKVMVLGQRLEKLEDIDLEEAERDLEHARKLARPGAELAAEKGELSGDLIAAAQARIRYARRHGRKS